MECDSLGSCRFDNLTRLVSFSPLSVVRSVVRNSLCLLAEGVSLLHDLLSAMDDSMLAHIRQNLHLENGCHVLLRTLKTVFDVLPSYCKSCCCFYSHTAILDGLPPPIVQFCVLP